MRGTRVVGQRIKKLLKVERAFKTDGNKQMATVAKMMRRELEWVLGAAPQEINK